MISPSVVSGAPLGVTVGSRTSLEGALLIQRLEGSRSHRSLCILYRPEGVHWVLERTELSRIRLSIGRMERRSVCAGVDLLAGESAMRGALVKEDKESAYAPKQDRRPRMGIELHAARRSGCGGERSSSCAAESRSTTCMVPPQTGQFQTERI